MSTEQAHGMSLDAALEAEIDYAAMRLATSTNHIDRKAWWNALCALHEQRSEDQARRVSAVGGGDAV